MHMPPLETERLLIRRLAMTDLDAIYQILDVEPVDAGIGTEGVKRRDERERWLRWTTLGYDEFEKLHQPPYGERGIVLRETGQLIGACGFAPCLDAFGRMPSFAIGELGEAGRLTSTQVGLFWAVAPAHQRRGYASEAARALIAYAFTFLHLHHIVATTTYDNDASMAVMRKAGMRIERNPSADPPWLQVVGVLHHPLVHDV
jgi:RimJ/RimL family protein N-acetyltransferase